MMMNAIQYIHTSSTALIQPSFSGLFVTWAYLPEKISHSKVQHICHNSSTLHIYISNQDELIPELVF